MNFEQLKTVLLEIKTILNNRPLNYYYDYYYYYYSDKNEPNENVIPNHMLYGNALKLCDSWPNCDVSKILLPGKINNIVNHFWDLWKKSIL